MNLGYTFDAVGNLEQLNAADQFTVKRRYTHDGQDQLALVEDAALVDLQAYACDATGNRTTFNDGTSQAYSYASGTHRLASVAGVARAYGAAGNLETVGGPATRSYGYNAANRMATATIGGRTASYRYNAMGQRVRKTVSSSDRYSVHDDAGRWIGDYDHSGNALQQIVWFGDLPLAVLVGSGSGQKIYYIQADALGTPRVVIDPSRDPSSVGGTVIWRWDLECEAFGATIPSQDPDGDSTDFVFDMRFPGQRYDAHTGLSYNYFRDYEPGRGRYVQSDPIGLAGGVATYAYASNTPHTLLDYFGFQAQERAPAPRGPTPKPGPFIAPTANPANDAFFKIPKIVLILNAARACATPIGMGAVLFAVPGNFGQPDRNCSDDPYQERDECRNDNECSKATKWQTQAAIALSDSKFKNEHEFKDFYGAVPNSFFGICACKDGSIVIKRTGMCGRPGAMIQTFERWK